MDRPKVKSVGAKGKKWRELQSRRSFKPVNLVRDPDRCFQSSYLDNPPGVRQNAKETSDEIFNDNLVVVEPVVGSQPLMAEDDWRFDEEYRKGGFDIRKDAITESVDGCEEKGGKRDHGKKTVRWVDDDEKSPMDLGFAEDERTKRLENLMEKRRSSKWSGLRARRNAMGNVSCDQISSLNIPKINPFLSKSSGDDPTSPPGSAPSNVAESNPFDLPYDPHEEKPILTGDDFEEEFTGTPKKERNLSRHVRFNLDNLPPVTTNFQSDFAIKQLSSGKLVTTALENKEDDDKQPQQDSSIPNDGIRDHHAREEGESSEKAADVVDIANEAAEPEAAEKAADVVEIANKAAEKAADVVDIANEAAEPEAAEKAADVVPVADSVPDEASGTETYTKEEREEAHREVVSSDQQSSSTSCSSSEDEPILRPNKEAILHCLSMSRMRLASGRNNFLRHSESYDCGPSALFDKSKTDGFFFGANKRIHYPSVSSVASDMQVEFSEVGSPPSTNISSLDDDEPSMDTEKGNRGVMMNSTDDPSEMDEWSDQETSEDGFSRWDYNHREPLESKINEQDAHYFTKKDGNQETKDQILGTATKASNSEMEHRKPIFVLQSESSIEANLAYEVLNEVQQSVEPLDLSVPANLPPTANHRL